MLFLIIDTIYWLLLKWWLPLPFTHASIYDNWRLFLVSRDIACKQKQHRIDLNWTKDLFWQVQSGLSNVDLHTANVISYTHLFAWKPPDSAREEGGIVMHDQLSFLPLTRPSASEQFPEWLLCLGQSCCPVPLALFAQEMLRGDR